jgi:hypothetical protein
MNAVKDYDNFFLPVDDLKEAQNFYENILEIAIGNRLGFTSYKK